MKVLNLATKCDATCSVCAREFFAWYKSRMKQMEMTLAGATTSFAQAAATSIRPKD